MTSDEQKQMITGARDRVPRRQGDRADDAGALVLREARGSADDRGGDPPRRGRGRLHRAGSYDVATQNATYAVTVNPLVNWIWLGFGVLAFGTGIALLPERAFAFAGARVPDGAVTTTLMLLLLLVPGAGRGADHRPAQRAAASSSKRTSCARAAAARRR